jgi:hypothetical protein
VDASYARAVFINCPLDEAYQPIFQALVFAIHDCGFTARCALEADNGGEVRIEKIARIIRSCQHGIHDVSRTEPDATNRLPRFNMPLELGLFLGARLFGGRGSARRTASSSTASATDIRSSAPTSPDRTSARTTRIQSGRSTPSATGSRRS